MVSPLGQRQMFQTVNAEAFKAAQEVSGQLQREVGQRQAMADRIAEAQGSVPEIPRTDGMKTEERQRGRQGQGQGREGSPGEGRDGAGQVEETPASAITADNHVDFLA
jgi:hypothetical protein